MKSGVQPHDLRYYYERIEASGIEYPMQNLFFAGALIGFLYRADPPLGVTCMVLLAQASLLRFLWRVGQSVGVRLGILKAAKSAQRRYSQYTVGAVMALVVFASLQVDFFYQVVALAGSGWAGFWIMTPMNPDALEPG